MSTTLGEVIRIARKAKGFTQRELADCVRIDHTYLSKIEHGACLPPSIALLHRIAGVLGMDEEPLQMLAGKPPVRVLRQSNASLAKHLAAIRAAASACKPCVHTRPGWVEVPEDRLNELMRAVEGEGGA